MNDQQDWTQAQKDSQEIRDMVLSFFKDQGKVDLWMRTRNPHLGWTSPNKLILVGRAEKVKAFVKAQLEGP